MIEPDQKMLEKSKRVMSQTARQEWCREDVPRALTAARNKELGTNVAFVAGSSVAPGMLCAAFEPEEKIEKVIAGCMGKYEGIPVYSDAYFHPDDKVIDRHCLKLVDHAE